MLVISQLHSPRSIHSTHGELPRHVGAGGGAGPSADGPAPTEISRAKPSAHRSLGLFKTADGLGLVIVDVKNGVELGNLQKIMNLFGEIQELQLSPLV